MRIESIKKGNYFIEKNQNWKKFACVIKGRMKIIFNENPLDSFMNNIYNPYQAMAQSSISSENEFNFDKKLSSEKIINLQKENIQNDSSSLAVKKICKIIFNFKLISRIKISGI